MAKFKYKYDTIKNIKEIQENKILGEISDIEMQISNKHDEINAIDEKQKELRDKGNGKKMRVLEMKYHLEYLELLEDQKEAIREVISELNEKLEIKKQELLQKTKEKKIFNKLEEKHREDFLFEQNKIDSANLDEIAIQRFARK